MSRPLPVLPPRPPTLSSQRDESQHAEVDYHNLAPPWCSDNDYEFVPGGKLVRMNGYTPKPECIKVTDFFALEQSEKFIDAVTSDSETYATVPDPWAMLDEDALKGIHTDHDKELTSFGYPSIVEGGEGGKLSSEENKGTHITPNFFSVDVDDNYDGNPNSSNATVCFSEEEVKYRPEQNEDNYDENGYMIPNLSPLDNNLNSSFPTSIIDTVYNTKPEGSSGTAVHLMLPETNSEQVKISSSPSNEDHDQSPDVQIQHTYLSRSDALSETALQASTEEQNNYETINNELDEEYQACVDDTVPQLVVSDGSPCLERTYFGSTDCLEECRPAEDKIDEEPQVAAVGGKTEDEAGYLILYETPM